MGVICLCALNTPAIFDRASAWMTAASASFFKAWACTRAASEFFAAILALCSSAFARMKSASARFFSISINHFGYMPENIVYITVMLINKSGKTVKKHEKLNLLCKMGSFSSSKLLSSSLEFSLSLDSSVKEKNTSNYLF